MRTIALTVITVDRSPRQNYLAAMLGNLNRSGLWRSRTPFTLHIVDSGSPDGWLDSQGVGALQAAYPDRVFVDVPTAGRRSANQNAARALEVGVASGADWILFTEDDIDVCDRFLDSVAAWIDRHAKIERRLYAFGAAYSEIVQLTARGIEEWDYPIEAFFGTQAIALWKTDAAEIADYIRHDPKPQLYDTAMKDWCRRRYPDLRYFLASAPSFVTHVGVESAIHFPRFHNFASWPGRAWSYPGLPPMAEAASESTPEPPAPAPAVERPPKPEAPVVRVAPAARPRLLWIGDAGQPTGFERVTRGVLSHLVDAWDVAVLGVNYHGDPHGYPFEVFPADPHGAGDVWGFGRVSKLVDYVKPDVIVMNNDPWNVADLLGVLKDSPVPIVGYMPIDGKNVHGALLNKLALAIFYTQFGATEAMAGGYAGPIAIIPHGVDPIFRPIPQAEARHALGLDAGLPADAFLVGNVNRNQPRKRLDLTISYFAEWARELPPNVFLFLHCSPRGDLGWNVLQLAKYFGIEKRLALTSLTLTPDRGVANEKLALVYNAFDVQISTTLGEGFGLTTLEGMACGIPQIVPDWSALGEWPGDAVWRVPCSSISVTPMNINVIGGVPDRAAFVAALDRAYRHADERADMAARARALASQDAFTWPDVAAAFDRSLRSVLAARRQREVEAPPDTAPAAAVA
jgi:D-inositol-3-phosphate glycosyltransferase